MTFSIKSQFADKLRRLNVYGQFVSNVSSYLETQDEEAVEAYVDEIGEVDDWADLISMAFPWDETPLDEGVKLWATISKAA